MFTVSADVLSVDPFFFKKKDKVAVNLQLGFTLPFDEEVGGVNIFLCERSLFKHYSVIGTEFHAVHIECSQKSILC